MSLPGWTYEFPRDHGSHPDFKTEWWYFTGNLADADARDFGYQLTFFRQGVIPPGGRVAEGEFGRRDVKFAHFAVSNLGGGKFHHFQRLVRGSFGEAGFDEGPRLAWIRDWECRLVGPHDFDLVAREGEVKVDLRLRSEKPPVFHGRDGVSQKGAGEGRASHYYSLTRLATTGTIEIGGRVHEVRGWSWFDHEWATNQLTADQKGWDWFSLQFEDGTDLMLFQIRTRSGGRDPFSSGTFVAKDGSSRKIDNDSFHLEPVRWWTSPKTGGRYPVGWTLRIPSLNLDVRIESRLDTQELAADPVIYWEGSVSAEGTRYGQPIWARGYLEMTGYAGEVQGMQETR
ncbi:MAG: lipocalin-like domain-containing protein [Terrimicrobiaceae bacterium]|nr:lipocalin-like domain-containing protein [Terrimicrobiaceae bacterium]